MLAEGRVALCVDCSNVPYAPALPRMVQPVASESDRSSMIGVLPMRSSTLRLAIGRLAAARDVYT